MRIKPWRQDLFLGGLLNGLDDDGSLTGFYLDGYLGNRLLPTRVAISLFLQREGKVIVETGCQHHENDWGAGCSTQILSRVVQKVGGVFHTIDIDASKIEVAKTFVPSDVEAHFHAKDSIVALREIIGPVDYLYLDSWDYPYVDIVRKYQRPGEIFMDTQIRTKLGVDVLGKDVEKQDQEILERYSDVILPCQEHCLREVQAAMPKLSQKCIVVFDDAHYPGGGKSRLAREYLVEKDWHVVFDGSQSVWIRGIV
jgi:hypothetical protein